MSILQQLSVIFFILYCSMLLILYHQQKDKKKSHCTHESQNLNSYLDPFLKLFGKELVSYIIRITISVGVGSLAALCSNTENNVVILVLLGILIGIMIGEIQL